MARYVILHQHHNGLDQVIRLKGNTTPQRAVALVQSNLRAFGHPDGVSWRLHEGDDIVSALIASHRFRKHLEPHPDAAGKTA